MHRAGAIVMALATLGGCARRMGERATEGALERMRAEAQVDRPGEAPIEVMAGRAMDSAIAHLEEPAQVAAIQRVVAAAGSQAAHAFTRTASDVIAGELGADGRSALAAQIAALASRAAAAATDGALRRLSSGCAPDDTACLDRRVAELGRSAAVGFMGGVKSSVDWIAPALAFLAGLALATSVALAVGLRRTRRALRQHLAAAPHGA